MGARSVEDLSDAGSSSKQSLDKKMSDASQSGEPSSAKMVGEDDDKQMFQNKVLLMFYSYCFLRLFIVLKCASHVIIGFYSLARLPLVVFLIVHG
jgi:hypothetical protein